MISQKRPDLVTCTDRLAGQDQPWTGPERHFTTCPVVSGAAAGRVISPQVDSHRLNLLGYSGLRSPVSGEDDLEDREALLPGDRRIGKSSRRVDRRLQEPLVSVRLLGIR